MVAGHEVGSLLVDATTSLIVTTDNDTDFAVEGASASRTALQKVLDELDRNKLYLPFSAGGQFDATSHKNLFCSKRDVAMESPRRAAVQCHYEYFNTSLNNENRAGVYVRGISSTLKAVTTYQDINGDGITVYRDGRLQLAEVSVLIPENVVTYDLTNRHDPIKLNNDYLGCINSGDWAAPGDKGKWLFVSILWRPLAVQILPQRWAYSVSLQYNQHGWNQAVVRHQDPDQPRPAFDDDVKAPVHGDATTKARTVLIYPEVDFLSHDWYDETIP